MAIRRAGLAPYELRTWISTTGVWNAVVVVNGLNMPDEPSVADHDTSHPIDTDDAHAARPADAGVCRYRYEHGFGVFFTLTPR